MDKYIEIYKIRNEDLPKATKVLNGNWTAFKSKVVDIIIDKNTSLLIVELNGSYPFITNQWESLILPI